MEFRTMNCMGGNTEKGGGRGDRDSRKRYEGRA
jgi:hypothetical protein